MITYNKRYHRTVFYPLTHKRDLQVFCNDVNVLEWQYSRHALDRMSGLVDMAELKGIGDYINRLRLRPDNIFEYYLDDEGVMDRACYRVKYSLDHDLIIIVSRNKYLVTVYLNKVDDDHITLNRGQYDVN